MDTRRLVLALGAALVISAVVTSLFYFRISRQESAARSKTKQVVAAAVDLLPGTPVPADKLTIINWPDSVPLKGLVENKDEVIGHVLMYPVNANEPLLKHDLAAGASFGLAAKIPDGMRATAVRVNEVNNVAGFMFPGCRIDLLLTTREGNTTTTRIILQNVQVLSAGTKTEPDPTGKPENVGVITLLVTPEDSEKIVLAQSQGSVQFVLRNGNDSAQVDAPPVQMAQLAGAPPAPAPSEVKTRRATPAVKAPAPYVVETIVGGKATITKFDQPRSQ